jgi:pimeloyl-ACP methyl ester carboxylesterase
MSNNRPRHFIVVVPGYMGSLLRDRLTGEIVWLDIPRLLKNPIKIDAAIDEMLDKMTYPNENLEPAGIMNQLLFIPPWAKQEQYGRLLEQLQEWGYQIDPEAPGPDDLAAYTFSYDWRQDNRVSAEQLAAAVAKWRAQHNGAEAWLIAHSNGGIVSRWYIKHAGGADHVGRLFLMGSPWDGAPKSMRVLLDGLRVLGLRRLNIFNLGERMGPLIRSFPSFYQLIPHSNPFLRDEDNQVVDLFGDPGWLDDPRDRAYLADALKFNQDLGTDLPVERLCFFGRQKPTVTNGVLRQQADKWANIRWIETSAGDGTVPESSAVHPGDLPTYAFAVDHGNIYIDPQVLPQLQWEIAGKYGLEERAILVTDEITIQFEPGDDILAPEETVEVWATVHRNEDGQAISNARIDVHLLWGEPLPGAETGPPQPPLPYARLEESLDREGYYTGSLKAPAQEGYYRLRATVVAANKAPVELFELVLVEAEPD